MANNVKRIGVLTSGGDAPGMNAAIRAVVLTSIHLGIECVGIRRGYNGLIGGDVVPMTEEDVAEITALGGTRLYTARSPEFMTKKGQKRGADNCRFMGIEGLVIIGGDGSYRGALELSRYGVPVICLPGTIDNDIGCTTYTIGFDTACNTAVDAVDKLDDTMQSHERCSVVEVMGHAAPATWRCNVGIADGRDGDAHTGRWRSISRPTSFDRIRNARHGTGTTTSPSSSRRAPASAHERGREKIQAVNRHRDAGDDARAHPARRHAARPGPRVTASRMGYKAVRLLADGIFNRAVCMNGESLRRLRPRGSAGA